MKIMSVLAQRNCTSLICTRFVIDYDINVPNRWFPLLFVSDY
jgi:hypothetical protein